MGQSRWGNIHSEAVISIIEELKATASIKKLYDEISLFGTARAGSISQWQEKRCENLAERLYKLGNLSPPCSTKCTGNSSNGIYHSR